MLGRNILGLMAVHLGGLGVLERRGSFYCRYASQCRVYHATNANDLQKWLVGVLSNLLISLDHWSVLYMEGSLASAYPPYLVGSSRREFLAAPTP